MVADAGRLLRRAAGPALALALLAGAAVAVAIGVYARVHSPRPGRCSCCASPGCCS